MIGTLLVLSHFILRKLGFIEDSEEETEFEPDCVSHESGAFPEGPPPGPSSQASSCHSSRQSGGTDEIPTPFSGYQREQSSHMTPYLFGQYLIEEENDDDVLTDSNSLDVNSTSHLRPKAFANESILEPRDDACVLAEYGSVGCDFIMEPLNRLIVSSDDILDSGCTGGNSGIALMDSVQNMINSETYLCLDMSPSESSASRRKSEELFKLKEVYNPEDFPASGDGSSSPVDDTNEDTEDNKKGVKTAKSDQKMKSGKTSQRTKSPPTVMDEVIATILSFDESKTGVGEPELMLIENKMMDSSGSLQLATSEGDNSLGNGNLFAMASFVPCVVTGISRDRTERLGFGGRDRERPRYCSNLELYLIEEEPL